MDRKIRDHGENPTSRVLHPGNHYFRRLCMGDRPDAGLNLPQFNAKSHVPTHPHQTLLHGYGSGVDLTGLFGGEQKAQSLMGTTHVLGHKPSVRSTLRNLGQLEGPRAKKPGESREIFRHSMEIERIDG